MRPFHTDAHGRTVYPMALSELHDDDELERLGYDLAVDLLAEQDTDEPPESSRRLAPPPWHFGSPTSFERHQAQRAV